MPRKRKEAANDTAEAPETGVYGADETENEE